MPPGTYKLTTVVRKWYMAICTMHRDANVKSAASMISNHRVACNPCTCVYACLHDSHVTDLEERRDKFVDATVGPCMWRNHYNINWNLTGVIDPPESYLPVQRDYFNGHDRLVGRNHAGCRGTCEKGMLYCPEHIRFVSEIRLVLMAGGMPLSVADLTLSFVL